MAEPSPEQVTQARLLEVISHAQSSLAWASAFLVGDSGDPNAQFGRKITALYMEMQALKKSIEAPLQESLSASSQEVAERLTVLSVLEGLEVANQSIARGFEGPRIKSLLQRIPAVPLRNYLFIEKAFRKYSEATDQIAKNIEQHRKKLKSELKP